ncbi:glycoside hydrolase family 19 protein [Plantactinospora sp. KBS50]|uniref:glycoside hydrolase family 19 protein n=1 Tax=Plantactinospora sp. KBS50 TaxID=2024580 RepID=UPI000BAAB48B|nr:glycoside hydrolase family 19 protein [Plantactinospora sp. KBS50]ASW53432.1 chitinase [Plantactinospora sp. KBS50]
MKIGKLIAARQAEKSVLNLNATHLVLALIGLIGFGPLVALALVALVVVIAVLLVLGAASSSDAGPVDPSASAIPADVLTAMTGDGKGTFAEHLVPRPDAVEPIKDAATECDLISPAILAAQIEVESGFDAGKIGPDGREGISQVPQAAFTKLGEDDDGNGQISALDVSDSIHAQARYLCALATEIGKLLDDGTIVGDRLSLTLLAYRAGLDAVTRAGGMKAVDPGSYPFQVRALFRKYLTDAPEASASAPGASPSGASPTGADPTGASPQVVARQRIDEEDGVGLTVAEFERMFPSRNSFYTYQGLVEAMSRFPAFAGAGDPAVRRRELAAFLANVDHESGGLVYVEEVNRSLWGNYCDAAQPYGCPAGQTAYHGRGPIQLSWNTNYKAAGDAIGIDLLNDPDRVRREPAVAWQTALWFWMTQTGAGTMTPHAAITGTGGFGETIRSINGALECNGGNTAQVRSRIDSYQRFAAALGVDPGDHLDC